MPNIHLAILAAVVSLALAVGCGGGGSDSASSAPPPTKAEFIRQADEICEDTDQKQEETLSTFFKKHPEVTGTRAWKEKIVVTAGLPPVQLEAEELAALTPPEGDEDAVAAIIEEMEGAVEKGREDPGTLAKKNASGPFARMESLAREYGFKACALPL